MAVKQAGWIARFVIIGVVLVILTVGVAYGVEKRGVQVRRDTAIAVADKDAAKTKPAVTTTQTPATPSNTAINSPSTKTPSTPAAQPPATATALPVTGPSLTVASILPLAVLAGTLVSFMLSTKRRRELYGFDLSR
jgi:hypothetical protein